MFKQFYNLISKLNLKFETKCLHFYQLIEYIEKYNIIVDFIYNWDEKDFLIDYASVIKQIMNLKAYKSDRITHALQNDNREFIKMTLSCHSHWYIEMNLFKIRDWMIEMKTNRLFSRFYFAIEAVTNSNIND